MAQTDPTAGKYSISFTSVGDQVVAESLAEQLVRGQVVACVSILPQAVSHFTWQGKLCRESEYILMMKGWTSKQHELAAAIKQHHPYEVPELIHLDVKDGAPSYLAWIDSILVATHPKR